MNLDLGMHRGRAVTTNAANQNNGHIGLVGMTGSGKSVEAQRLICSIINHGGIVLALDMHGTLEDDQIFWKYTEVFQEKAYEIDAHAEGIPCSLLSPISYPDGTEENAMDTIDSVTDIFSSAIRTGSAQKAELRSAIRYLFETGDYEESGIRTLDTALKYAHNKTAERLREKLHPITAHNAFVYGVDLFCEEAINIFRLSRYSEDTQQVIAEILLAYIWRLARTGYFKRKEIYLFVDECQNMPSGKDSTLAQMLSEGRKFGVNLILATQMVLQGNVSAVQQRFTQCGLLLYFKPAANRVSLTAKMIDAMGESAWSRLLRTLQTGEFIADGNFLVDGKEVNEPLKVSGREPEKAVG